MEGPWQRRLAYLFPLVSAFLILVTILSVGASLWQSRGRIAADSERNLHGIGQALAQQTARTLDAVDLTLIATVDSLRYSGLDWQPSDDPRIWQIMQEKQSRSPYIRSLYLADKNGGSLYLKNNPPGAPIVVTDRAYFTIHKTNLNLGPYVSPPVISRIMGDWIIPISRRLENSDGSFAGVIVAAIAPAAVFGDLYRSMKLGEDFEISLFRDDGTLLVRYPEAPDGIGKSFSKDSLLANESLQGAFRATSPIDGIRRMYVRQQVPGSPLFLLISDSESAIFADWRKNMATYAVVAPLLLIAFGGLTLLLFRYTRYRDITFRALRQSEQRFRDFAEAASDRFWETDDQYRFIWHSTGEINKDLIGRTRWELGNIDMATDEHWRAHKADIDARRPFRDFEYARRQKDGLLYHRTVSGKPYYDKNGVFKGFRGTYRDITRRVTAQHQATIHRDRFLRAIENLAEGFALYDSDDRLVLCNTQYRELHKPVIDKLAPGTPFEDFLRQCLNAGFITEARGREESWLAERLASHRHPPNIVEGLRQGRWYQIREQRDKDGGTLFFVLDIHDQKMSDLQNKTLIERIRMQFECMPVACLFMSPEFRVMDWNPAAQRIFGFTREEMIGASPYGTIIPDTGKDYVQGVARRLLAGEIILASHAENLTKSGERIQCEWHSTPVFDSDNTCIGILSMAMDITEKRKAEEKLRQAQRMEAIGQLTGGIAHDFNNLLQVILGNSDILIQAMPKDQPLLRWVEMTKTAAERGANLTQRLLAFSRQQVLEPTVVDLKTLIVNFIDLLKLTLGEHIEIVPDVPDILAPVRLDVGQFENALLNLALNARDAMPQGGRLTITARNITLIERDGAEEIEPGDYIALSVTDTGSGMPADVVKRAFEPFFTTKAVNKGSGLGLSMVYGFVTQSGGQLKIKSKPGRGTKITMWFPRTEAAATTTNEIESPPPLKPPAVGSETIMVVEDDDMVRDYVSLQLRSLGYAVDEAENGAMALDKLANDPPDLLFTDIIMPGGMSGFDLADEVARRYPATKILFTSGYTDRSGAERQPLPAGAQLLIKPYSRVDLARRVREVFDTAANARN